ncbi:hypothetical protein ACLB2K_024659 [Fragaria x ananassa]
MIFRDSDLIEVLSLGAPASQAISIILEKGHQMEIIKIGTQGGLCSKYGIIKDKETFIFIAVSSSQGLKVLRKLVEDCIARNLRPSGKLKRFQRKDKKKDQVMHKLQAFCL